MSAATLLGDPPDPSAVPGGTRGPYDASPGLSADIVAPTPSPAPAPAPAPAAAPGPAPSQKVAPPLAFDAGAERLVDAGLPFGSHVEVELRRAAEGSTVDGDTAAETWLPVFSHHAVADSDVQALVDAGKGIAARGLPDDATVARWRADAQDELQREFGGPENAASARQAADQYLGRHPQLNAWLRAHRLDGHPAVVRAVAKAAHRARNAGKLR